MFGKYRLIRPLAEGGMAQVYIAKQLGLEGFEKVVVLKRILPQHSKNPEFVAMFLDEARISARLSHPNLVQIFDFGLQDNCYFLAMEYLAGENLSSIMRAVAAKKEHIPSEIAATIIASACAGLHYAHSITDEKGVPLGIVHRDVSPSNLMVTHQGIVKVLDFGIAKAEGKLAETQTGVVKGKWVYMSPEQVKSEPLTGQSDVFSLGLILYELTTGVKLFQRDNELAIIAAVMTTEIKPPRQLRPMMPQEMEDVIMKAVDRDKSKRFQSAAEMERALLQFIAHRTFVNPAEALQKYVIELFGETRMKELRTMPTTDPGLAEPMTEAVDSGRTAYAAPPSHLQPPRQSKWTRVAIVVGPTLLIGLIAVGAFLMGQGKAPPADPANPPALVASVLPTLPHVEPAAVHDAGAAAVEPVAAVPPPVEPTRVVAKKGKPVLAKAAVEYGTLQVNCVPWCRIYLDGVDTGRNSPVSDLKLEAGKHKLKVVNPPSGSERERSIDIAPNAVRREVIKL
jgi:serine/threonine protein kinase